MLYQVLIVARTKEHEILSRFVYTSVIVVVTILMDNVNFDIDLK